MDEAEQPCLSQQAGAVRAHWISLDVAAESCPGHWGFKYQALFKGKLWSPHTAGYDSQINQEKVAANHGFDLHFPNI